MSVVEQNILATGAVASPNAIDPGRSSPLGANLVSGGANFSLYSRRASEIELLLFDREDDRTSCTRNSFGPGGEPYLSLLARLCWWRESGTTLWVSGSWAIRSR